MIKYNLTVDIGNTHIVLGIYHQNDLIHSWRLSSDRAKTEDEYYIYIRTLLEHIQVNTDWIQKIAICSVVPDLTRAFKHFSSKYFSAKTFMIDAYSPLGLKFPMDNPGFIGADLVINAFSAKEKYLTNALICDFGTATTIQLIEKNGFFHGTIIMPGIRTSAMNLFNKASLISNIQLMQPKSILGTSTVEAVRSGVVLGNTLLVDALSQRIKQEYKHLNPIKVIATGGIANMISEASKEIDIVDKNLTIDGLNLYCLRN